jgi:transposase
MDSGLVLAAAVHTADQGDADTLLDRVRQAQINPVKAGSAQGVEEAVADKGYHKAKTLAECQQCNTRTYIPEAKGKDYNWQDKPEAWRRAVQGNRRRVKGARSKRLQRRRGELVERSFAHGCETGGGRRTWRRGREDVTKRYVVQVAGYNLGVLLRKLFGVGKPKALQGARGLLAGAILCGYWLGTPSLGRRYGQGVAIAAR